jgi:ribulose kinase
VNRSIGKSPFEIVYGRTLKLAVNLATLPKLPRASVAMKHLAEHVKSTQEEVCQHLEESYAKYKTTTDKGRRSKIFERETLLWSIFARGDCQLVFLES